METCIKELNEKQNLMVHLPLTDAEKESGSQSKLKYAMQAWSKRVVKCIESLNEEKVAAQREHAAEDEKDKTIITNANGAFKYTKEGDKKLREALKVIDNKNVKLDPYLFTDEERILTFDPFLVEELRGFFFPALINEKQDGHN